MNVVAVVLAAGEARRFGSPKQVARLEGQALVRIAAQTALCAGLVTHVVTGAHARLVSECLNGLAVSTSHNANWVDGLGASIAHGVSALADPLPQGVLLMLADQPGVGLGALKRLLAAFARQPDRIIASDAGAFVGSPCVFPASLFGALRGLRGDQGARSVLRANQERIVTVAMPEAAGDVDTPADLARWKRPLT